MDNLHKVLKDIYYMTNRIKFSAEYVEKLSPSERELYISYYMEDKKKEEENRNKKNNAGPTLGTPLE